MTVVPVPLDSTAASAALETLRPASASHARVAPPDAVNVSATGPGATSPCAPKGIATRAPGTVKTVVGVLSTATALGTLTGASAVPLAPSVDINEAVNAAVLNV